MTKLIAIWAVIASAGGGFAAVAIRSAMQPPDPFVACQRGGTIAVSTIVVVDATDPLTDIFRRRLRATVESEQDRLPRGGKLTILVINAAQPGEPVELLSACDPGSPNTTNPMFETASRTEQRWRETFADPIEAALREAVGQPPSRASPIIQTIAAVEARPDFDRRVAQRRLVLVSDLLEYDAGIYSQLGGGDLWGTYRASTLPGRVQLDLRGVAVSIDYLARPAYAAVQGERHRGFWHRLLGDAGAAGVSFVGLADPGATGSDADNRDAAPPQQPRGASARRKVGRRAST